VSVTVAVSIPLRFDWNWLGNLDLYQPKKVSIPLRFDWNELMAGKKWYCEISFHTSKVRLKLSINDFRVKKINVSIPLRFDWNIALRVVLAQERLVSIPLRFDWNHKGNESLGVKIICFHTSKVRLKQNWKTKPPTNLHRFHTSKVRLKLQTYQRHTEAARVSIPLRFDWNRSSWQIPRT